MHSSCPQSLQICMCLPFNTATWTMMYSATENGQTIVLLWDKQLHMTHCHYLWLAVIGWFAGKRSMAGPHQPTSAHRCVCLNCAPIILSKPWIDDDRCAYIKYQHIKYITQKFCGNMKTLNGPFTSLNFLFVCSRTNRTRDKATSFPLVIIWHIRRRRREATESHE